MSYEIEPRKVAGVVAEANRALEHNGFNQGEVMIGLAELLGRVIVEGCQTFITMEDAHKVVSEHILATIQTLHQAQGGNIG